jgi:hypothetical protein
MFRHSCIYVRGGAGITRPKDLISRTIGAAQLDSTGVVFIKGMLSHDYGVAPDWVKWIIGGWKRLRRLRRCLMGTATSNSWGQMKPSSKRS